MRQSFPSVVGGSPSPEARPAASGNATTITLGDSSRYWLFLSTGERVYLRCSECRTGDSPLGSALEVSRRVVLPAGFGVLVEAAMVHEKEAHGG